MAGKIITICTKAFATRGVEILECMVRENGDVVVYDRQDGEFTADHSMSASAQRAVRKAACGHAWG